MKRLKLVSVVLLLFLTVRIGIAYNLEVKAYGARSKVENVIENLWEGVILNITISNINDFDASKLKIDDLSTTNLEDVVCEEVMPSIYGCSLKIGPPNYNPESHEVYYDQDIDLRKIVNIYLDDKPPEIKEFSLEEKNVKPEEEIRFKLKSVDNSAVGTTKCAGLKTLKLILNNGAVYEYPLYENSGYCNFEGEIGIAAREFDNLNEANQICVVVSDFLGKESEPVCKSISFDGKPPEMESGSFSLFTLDGCSKVGPYFQKNKLYILTPHINFREEMDEIKVRGNFSITKNGVKISNKELWGSCTRTNGDEFECYFASINFMLTESNSQYALKYEIKAKDEAENVANYNGEYQIYMDDIRPKISEIKSITSVNEQYLTSKSTIAVVFDEQGCGFNGRKAYISSYAFGRKGADECYNENNQWICLFKDVNIQASDNEKQINIAVTSNSGDDCNNKVDSTTGQDFFVDLDKPIINEINVTNQDGELFIKEGDLIMIKLTGKDFSDAVYVEGNFSKVNGDDSLYVHSCEKLDSSNFSCVLQVSSAMNCNEEVPLRIYDNANNSIIKKVTINVYRRDENPSNDFWSIGEIKIYPEKIDRSISEKINLYAFVDIEFNARRGNRQNLVSFLVDNCESEINAEITPLFQNDYSPGNKIISFRIKIPAGTSVEEESEEINCTFSLKTHTNGVVTVNPEKEQVLFTLKFYDGNLVDGKDQVFEKIKYQYELVKNLNGFMGSYLIPGYNLVKDICNAYTSFSEVTRDIDALATASSLIPGINLQLEGVATQMNLEHQQVSNFLGDFCKWTSCENQSEEVCNKIKGGGGYFSSITSCPDVSQNLILGIATGCYIPPIINTLSNYYYVETSRLDCYIESLNEGYPFYVCDNMASQYICENVLSQFVEGALSLMMPEGYAWYSTITNFAGIGKESLENPLSTALSLIMTAIPFPQTYMIGINNILSSVQTGIDTFNHVNDIVSQFEQFGSGHAAEVLSKYEDLFGGEDNEEGNLNINNDADGENIFEDFENID